MDKEKLKKQIRNYKYAVESGRLGRQSPGAKQATVSAYAQAAEVQSEVEGRVRETLSTEPVSVIYVGAYLGFALEIQKWRRRLPDGPALAERVSEVFAKWKSWKLDGRIMERILTEVLELTLAGRGPASERESGKEGTTSERQPKKEPLMNADER